MARPETIQIIKHVPLDELRSLEADYDKQLESYASIKRIRNRVCFIRMRYNGYSVEEAASNIGFTTKTGYNIQESWNEHGMDGLKPNFKGGPKSRLTDEQKEKIKEALRLNPMSTKDVRLYIQSVYGIEYSDKQIHVILTKMGLHHSKPYHIDHRRPADAETVLKKDSKMLWIV